MKRISFNRSIFILWILLLEVHAAQAQVIDNKGNRNQTYPLVTETNPTVVEMINQVDTMNLYNTIAWMQQYIRDASSPEALLTQNYLLDRFDELGLETYVHDFPMTIGGMDTLDAGNIIAIQQGTEFPEKYVIVSAHYDHHLGPGADDNASGTSGVLECARILSQYSFKRTILYIVFNGEEYGRLGSYPFAQKCAREEMEITGVFNMDMIGFWPGNEYGDITMYSGYSYISQRLFDFYQQVANLYIPEIPTHRFTHGDSSGGDHNSFNIREYPALYIGDIEYLRYHPYYHTPADSIGAGVNCFALAEGFVKAVIAATAELANGWMAPQDFSAIVKDGNVFLSWDDAPETESYKVFKDGGLLVETTENTFVDLDFVGGEWHKYYVKGINSDGLESPASNPDSVFFLEPLQIPVFYDFEDGTAEGLILNNDNWSFANWQSHNGLKSTTNTMDNILQIAEFQWFSIPESVEDISLGLKIARLISNGWLPYSPNVYVEVTTDRKTWHKLATVLPAQQGQWGTYTISLNDFIGQEYVQPRIRFEGNGRSGQYRIDNVVHIDDLYISFSSTETAEHLAQESFKLLVTPNPSNGVVTITTGLEHTYCLTVFNLTGIKLFSKESFSDGTLDLSSFSQGTYFIAVDNGTDRITKRVVLK
ncbi:MAG: M28 family peptidase [Bacteroidales bacterium]|nr:M28 family peptidase [Bacteroidales bacterium]